MAPWAHDLVFERMALREIPAYKPFHAQYDLLFNSYYNALGPKWARNMRGALSRPTVRDIFSYRSYVDRHLMGILKSGSEETVPRISWLIELGIHHEQQHQELLLTDLKAILAQSPEYPVYPVYRHLADVPRPVTLSRPEHFTGFPAGRYEIGFGDAGFAYDNERPAHFVWLGDFELQNRLASNGEFLDFMNDDGYQRPELWLSDAWEIAQQQGWSSPLYWVAGRERRQRFMADHFSTVSCFNRHSMAANPASFHRCSEKSGNGHRAPTCRTRDSVLCRGRWVSTMANS